MPYEQSIKHRARITTAMQIKATASNSCENKQFSYEQVLIRHIKIAYANSIMFAQASLISRS